MRYSGLLRTRLAGLRVAVDVQHLYREGKRRRDQGAVFTLGDGTHVTEGSVELIYSAHLGDWLRARGAEVWISDPARAVLTGPYSRRNGQANSLSVHAYLACHVNAGHGAYGAAEAINGTAGIALGSYIVRQLIGFDPTLRTSRVVRLNPEDRGAVCIRDVQTGRAAVILEPLFGDYLPHQLIMQDNDRIRALAVELGEGVARWWESR